LPASAAVAVFAPAGKWKYFGGAVAAAGAHAAFCPST